VFVVIIKAGLFTSHWRGEEQVSAAKEGCNYLLPDYDAE
jgi:hypothetical protein